MDKKMYLDDTNEKKARVSILISERSDFKVRKVIRN